MKWIITALAVIGVSAAVIIINAPPPDAQTAGGAPIPISAVFTILEAENDAVRELWTKEIVGQGKERGLAFHKDWREPQIDAGPLPALFLRETAESLRRNPLPLYLFLGSDFPVNDANKFTGVQQARFAQIKQTGNPQFFLDEDVNLHTAMFSDIAVAETCVVCHNTEPESPKTDWKLGDIMGATTWSYPNSEVSLQEALAMVGALRQGFREAYEEYLAKAAAFADSPPVGERWPAAGYYLPSADAFIAEAELRTSATTMRALLEFGQADE